MLFHKKKEEIPIGKVNMQISNDLAGNQFLAGLPSYKDLFYPSGIDVMHPDYINIDGSCIACLLCMNLPYEVQGAWLDDLINYGEGVEIAMYHTPVDKSSAVRDITQYLGYTKVKLDEGDNQIDSAVQESAAASSVYMKKKLAEGDELWYINLLIKVTADSEESLKRKMRVVEGLLVGKDILYKRATFRQLEAFLSTLPIGKLDKRIAEKTERNILSSGLAAFYPFTASSLCDAEGIFLGGNAQDSSQVILDMFDTTKYANANMFLTGSSGSGKTYTTQMIANRFRMLKIPVLMICPLKGHEYRKLCENVGGNYFRLAGGTKTVINVMDIRPTKNLENPDESLLAAKLQRLQIFFSLLLPDISKRDLKLFDGLLKDLYETRGILMDNASLYQMKASSGVVTLSPRLKEMPVLADVYQAMKTHPQLQNWAEEMRPFIDGSLSFFNGQTNIDLENLYTVADISDIEANYITLAMYVVLDIYWDRVKRNPTERIAMLLDELWKLIGTAGNVETAESVLEIFKIIRGYGGAAIAATQDIQDFMALENGKYGRGIINACKFKIILQQEELEAEALQEILKLSEEERTRVTHFKRGSGLLYAASNHLAVNFIAFKKEHELITTDRKELLRIKKEGERNELAEE